MPTLLKLFWLFPNDSNRVKRFVYACHFLLSKTHIPLPYSEPAGEVECTTAPFCCASQQASLSPTWVSITSSCLLKHKQSHAGSGEVVDWRGLAWASLGTLGCAAAANTLNQVYEVANDAVMKRTMRRPLPMGRVTARHALAFAGVASAAGIAVLYYQARARGSTGSEAMRAGSACMSCFEAHGTAPSVDWAARLRATLLWRLPALQARRSPQPSIRTSLEGSWMSHLQGNFCLVYISSGAGKRLIWQLCIAWHSLKVMLAVPWLLCHVSARRRAGSFVRVSTYLRAVNRRHAHGCAGKPADGGPGRGQHRAVCGRVHAAEGGVPRQHLGRRGGRRGAAADGLGRCLGHPGAGRGCSPAPCGARELAKHMPPRACALAPSTPASGRVPGWAARLARPGGMLRLVASVPKQWQGVLCRAGVLAAALYFWQLPHFLALAWLCRADYAAGGYRMLSLADATGRRTAACALRNCAYLAPVGAAAVWLGVASPAFAGGAALLAGAYALPAAAFYQVRLALRRVGNGCCECACALQRCVYVVLVRGIVVWLGTAVTAGRRSGSSGGCGCTAIRGPARCKLLLDGAQLWTDSGC